MAIDFIAGIDFGFTNPAAVIPLKIDKDRNYYAVREWYKTGQTESQIAEYTANQRFNKVYPDPESASGVKELRNAGVNVRTVTKNNDSVRVGISKIRELFKQNRLFISTDCANLIDELETYSYPEKRDRHNEEENPIKENDHALDALRYAIATHSTTSSGATTFIPQHIGNIHNKIAKQFIPRL